MKPPTPVTAGFLTSAFLRSKPSLFTVHSFDSLGFKNKHLRTGHSATLPSSLPRCPLLIQVILHTWHGKSIPSAHHVLPYPAVTLSHVIIYTGDVFTFCSLAPSHPHCNTLFSPCLNSSTHFHNIFS